ncbi:ArnT family glycosyltransferase [Paenibacillus sp. UNC451MF]|uniref:ArnT family glycosyltransferase n=1 Tax=Paenibacillus sp. UNC451MF TaxID=1449063 RepID=UPI00048C563F|nr:hypothetical protein [Paenibacillus sp. UNC451MF]
MVKLHRSMYWALFLLLFGLEFAVGFYVSHTIGYVHSDAMSRVANAFYVLFSRDPHLGAIGFVWTPLPSLVDLIFLLPYRWFPALASSGVAGVIMSSLFAGMTAAMLARAAISFGLPGWFAIVFSLLFSCNPFMFLFGANGMSDAPFIFFIMYSVVHLSHWIRSRNVRSLIKVSFALALAFWTRYEAVPLGAAMGLAVIIIVFLIPRYGADREQLPKHKLSYKYFHVEGTWVLLLSPIVFSGLLWIWFNYLIMGNPLFFLNGDYSNVAQAQQLASEEKFAEMIGNPISASWFVLKKTAYYSIPLVSIILLRIWNRRWFFWDFLVLVLLFISIITLQWLMLLKGTSYGWFRYFMYVLPITVAWLPYELARVKKTFFNYSIVISGMAATCVLLTSALMNPQIAPDENKFIQAKHYAVSQTVEKEIAHYLDTELAGYNILMDSYSAYSVILNSQHPEKYLITSDFEFHESLEDPVGSGVDFILSPKPDKSSADSIDNQKYQLYDKGAPWCELYKEFGGKWRLYKVIRTLDGGSPNEQH